MLMVAVRAGEARPLTATLTVTVPGPVPAAGDTLIHETPRLEALHVHSLSVLTLTSTEPPAPVWVVLVGVIAKLHGAAAWSTAKDCPAMLMVADRLLCAPLASTLTVTVPGPVPAAGDTLSHETPRLEALHAHPLPVLTATVLEPSAADRFVLDGVIAKLHAGQVVTTGSAALVRCAVTWHLTGPSIVAPFMSMAMEAPSPSWAVVTVPKSPRRAGKPGLGQIPPPTTALCM